jgi:hypothetical protein
LIARLDGSGQGAANRARGAWPTTPGPGQKGWRAKRGSGAAGSAAGPHGLERIGASPAPRRSARQRRRRRGGDTVLPPNTEGLDLAKIQQLWDGFVTFVRQKKVSLGVCLISGKPYAFDGKRLLIRFVKSFALQREQASRPESLEFVRAMFERYFGHAVEIVCFAEGEEKALALDEALQKKPPEERFRDIPDDKKPVVQRLIKEFDGEIIRYQT